MRTSARWAAAFDVAGSAFLEVFFFAAGFFAVALEAIAFFAAGFVFGAAAFLDVAAFFGAAAFFGVVSFFGAEADFFAVAAVLVADRFSVLAVAFDALAGLRWTLVSFVGLLR